MNGADPESTARVLAVAGDRVQRRVPVETVVHGRWLVGVGGAAYERASRGVRPVQRLKAR